MLQSQSNVRYASNPLVALYEPNANAAFELPVNLAPNTTFVKGTILGPVTSSANDVQTVTITGTPTGGTFALSGTNPLTGVAFTTAAIAYNASAANVQTELVKVANFGAGNVTCSGGALPGTAVVVTFAGSMVSMPVAVMTIDITLLTGGAPAGTVTHTTTGRTAGTYGKYNSAVAAVPGAPTVSGTGSGSAFAAGTYLVQVTGVNAQGETTPSIATPVTLTAAQKIRVAALASLDTSFTTLNVYVNGVLVGPATVSAGTSTQTDFDVAAMTVKGTPPLVNTAYTVPNGAGTQVAKGILMFDCVTDAVGNITYGTASGGGPWGETVLSTPAYFAGYFNTALLTGLDATAVAQFGRLVSGTTTNGVLRVY